MRRLTIAIAAGAAATMRLTAATTAAHRQDELTRTGRKAEQLSLGYERILSSTFSPGFYFADGSPLPVIMVFKDADPDAVHRLVVDSGYEVTVRVSVYTRDELAAIEALLPTVELRGQVLRVREKPVLRPGEPATVGHRPSCW